MNQYAVFVDAGYFFAAGAQALSAEQKINRKYISIVNHQEMIKEIIQTAAGLVGDSKLLRVYWYDAMPGPRMSLDQTTLANLPGVKVRLGVLNGNGQQKGVDSLILTDMLELARNLAISDAVLIGGDEDLKVGVDLGQAYGVRFHLVGIKFGEKNQSPTLRMAADNYGELKEEFFKSYLQSKLPALIEPSALEIVPESSTESDVLEVPGAVGVVVDGLHQDLLNGPSELLTALIEHLRSASGIPPEFDKKLIARVGAKCGRRLTGDESRYARGVFKKRVLQKD